jgi:hypothetical protein
MKMSWRFSGSQKDTEASPREKEEGNLQLEN